MRQIDLDFERGMEKLRNKKWQLSDTSEA